MIISPLPPISNTNLEKCIFDFLYEIHNYFIEDHFENRYYPRFKWFKEILDLSDLHTILNIGCSRGRETFYLLWDLNATSAIGIDKDPKRINSAIEATQLIKDFNNSCIPKVLSLSSLSEEYRNELRHWHEYKFNPKLKNEIIPEFLCCNPADNINQLPLEFDFIYCRYVLHDALEDGDNISALAENISSVLKPKTGKLVIVEPTLKGKEKYDFTPYFLGAKLTLYKEEIIDECLLGRADIFTQNAKEEEKGKHPKGSIFYKP